MTRICLLALMSTAGALVPSLAQSLANPPPPLLDTGPAPRPALDTILFGIIEKMNAAMSSLPLVGEPDHDFAITMRPHDDGAVALAQFELDHGTDPKLRELATQVVATAKARNAALVEWLKAHPVK